MLIEKGDQGTTAGRLSARGSWDMLIISAGVGVDWH